MHLSCPSLGAARRCLDVIHRYAYARAYIPHKWKVDMVALGLKVSRRVDMERPAMETPEGATCKCAVVEVHHDFAAALALKRFNTLTCSFPESLHLFVCVASFSPERQKLMDVSGTLSTPILHGFQCCWSWVLENRLWR